MILRPMQNMQNKCLPCSVCAHGSDVARVCDNAGASSKDVGWRFALFCMSSRRSDTKQLPRCQQVTLGPTLPYFKSLVFQ